MKKLIGIFLPTEFQVVFQSSSDVVLQSLKRAVPLCCLSSHHSESTYTWKCLEQPSTQYPSSPILHVKKAGTYKCTVYWGDQQTASHLFVVKCIPGIYIHATQTLLLVHIIAFTAQYILGQSDKRSQQILQTSPAYDTSKIYPLTSLKIISDYAYILGIIGTSTASACVQYTRESDAAGYFYSFS